MTALVRAKVAPEQRDALVAFVRDYYGQVDPDDLAERQLADLYGAALSHWNFARKREPGRARVRVFNPTIEEHGWQSTHTIIEIVNDDMPFLVDSVTMEVNRHGLTLHLIVHPIIDVDARRRRHAHRHRRGRRAGRAARIVHPRRGRPRDRRDSAGRSSPRDVERVLGDVRLAVADWKAMRERALAIVARARERPAAAARGRARRRPAFLRWLADNHFTFLGYRRHDLVDRRRPGRAAGSSRTRASASCARRRRQGRRGELRRAAARRSAPTRAGRSCSSSPSRRRARPCIGPAISTTSRSSASTPRATSSARTASSAFSRRPRTARTRPTFRSCAARWPTSSRAPASPPGSHAGKALLNILATYPRDELFQTGEDDLLRTAIGHPASGRPAALSPLRPPRSRSSASCRASSTRRARTTRPSCARSGRRS